MKFTEMFQNIGDKFVDFTSPPETFGGPGNQEIRKGIRIMQKAEKARQEGHAKANRAAREEFDRWADEAISSHI